jgi:hypothetical protein
MAKLTSFDAFIAGAVTLAMFEQSSPYFTKVLEISSEYYVKPMENFLFHTNVQ